jgi:hypothetical protein
MARQGVNEMTTNAKPTTQGSDSQQQLRAQRRAQEAVQEALDRRDNGGDAATATDQ